MLEAHSCLLRSLRDPARALMFLTKLAVELATSFAH